MEPDIQERSDDSDNELPPLLPHDRKLERYLDRKRAKYAEKLRQNPPPSISTPAPLSPQDYYHTGWPSPRVDRSPIDRKKPRRMLNFNLSLVTIHITADTAKSLIPSKSTLN